ncbi:MAG: hypothetical protein V1732_06065 [Patescibacteria group bacterium]
MGNGLRIPLGISLGKSKNTSLEEAVKDYLCSFFTLYSFGDYFVINISSPNTPNLRKLQDKERLKILLAEIQEFNKTIAVKRRCLRKKILVKIAPNLSLDAIDEILQVCFDYAVDGIIAVNSTDARDGLTTPTTEEGGLSGGPLWGRAYATTLYLNLKIRGKIPIIGVGGISTAAQAYAMFQHADLIQIYSSLIYKGPFIIRRINEGLKQLMNRDGVKNISEIRQWR